MLEPSAGQQQQSGVSADDNPQRAATAVSGESERQPAVTAERAVAAECTQSDVVVLSESDVEKLSRTESKHVQFDIAACCNSGRPIDVEWDNKQRDFVDGFGLCSPCRWRPKQRGDRRTPSMVKLANDTFQILMECVKGCIPDVRNEAFRLVTGKLPKSPFPAEALAATRAKWFALLKDPGDAAVLDEGQPFFLRALAQWLVCFEDPDTRWLVDEADSFATGVCLRVTKPLPRSPQIFPEKLKHRKLDHTEFCPIAENYLSAQLSVKELEDKFKEEESLGRMHPSKLRVLKQEYGMGVPCVLRLCLRYPSQMERCGLYMTPLIR